MGGHSVATNLSFFISALIITPVVAFTGSYPETFVMLSAVSALVCVMCSVTRICSKVRSHM
ncbi:MAG: hypothetical protein LBV63_02805 [Candidatus Methanoplasma sp.]|nr:hypothetical protein [Candidatus Methanoplasma sp.]